MPLGPGAFLGPYEIIAAIGAGGMGEVYKARDTKLGRNVALKLLPEAVAADPERLARLHREAQVLASLNHPNIASIHGFEDGGGMHALVMELVEGETLADRIARGPIPFDEALPIARQIAQALEAVHELGIIHRDLKPANIKVRPDGSVKVLDFGLAKAMEPAAVSSANATMSPTLSMHATMAGVILGTAAYMSPEQARGKAVDKRADIWAFGVVLFEMLTGQRAFGGEDLTVTLARVVERDPDFDALPPSVPARVYQAVRVCLRKDPKQRVGDIRDVRLALEGAFETASLQAAAPVKARRRAMPVALASVVGGAIVAALATWMLTRPSPPTPAPLIRFSADLGPDAVAGPRITVAISPDGTRIIFPIRGINGTPQLATRLLDQATPTPLPTPANLACGRRRSFARR